MEYSITSIRAAPRWSPSRPPAHGPKPASRWATILSAVSRCPIIPANISACSFFCQLPVDTPIYVYASNPSGAIAKAPFRYKVFKKFRKSTIALESMNVDRIVNRIDPDHKIPGDPSSASSTSTARCAKLNNKTLADLRFQTEPKFLWSGAFLPMVDSTVESRFADDRTYTWQGKKVDEQTHLGFDLAKLGPLADTGIERRQGSLGRLPGHLRKLRCHRPRLWLTEHLWTHE